MTGEGGMAIRDWHHLRDLRLVHLWLKGYARRHRVTYDVGKVIARAAVAPHCKHVPENYPYVMPWEQPEVIDGQRGMSEQEKDAEMERILAEFRSRNNL